MSSDQHCRESLIMPPSNEYFRCLMRMSVPCAGDQTGLHISESRNECLRVRFLLLLIDSFVESDQPFIFSAHASLLSA